MGNGRGGVVDHVSQGCHVCCYKQYWEVNRRMCASAIMAYPKTRCMLVNNRGQFAHSKQEILFPTKLSVSLSLSLFFLQLPQNAGERKRR